jgi:hypothetical protein
MTYACPAWEFAAECHLLKLQRLQNKVLRTIGNFQKRTLVRDMHKAIHTHNKIMQTTSRSHKNHENENVRYIGQSEA